MVTLNLVGANGVLTAMTTAQTDANGSYSFMVSQIGTYRVTVTNNDPTVAFWPGTHVYGVSPTLGQTTGPVDSNNNPLALTGAQLGPQDVGPVMAAGNINQDNRQSVDATVKREPLYRDSLVPTPSVVRFKSYKGRKRIAGWRQPRVLRSHARVRKPRRGGRAGAHEVAPSGL